MVVPPVLVVLSRHPAVDRYDLSSLRWLFSGAAPLPTVLAEMVTRRILSKRPPKDKAGCCIVQGYGLTETSPVATLLPPAYSTAKLGSVGVQLPNQEVRMVDEHDVDVKEGEPGELWLRGPNIMKGYLNNLEATKASITSDGWFKSGDVAVRDKDGFYYIVDRKKELIKYKGFQVPPAELEALLLTHPNIADVAVVGVYSPSEATELPRAYVVHASPKNVSSDQQKAEFSKEVAKWVQERAARYKWLRGGVVLIDIIPKSPSGKILRRELRERAKGEKVEAVRDVKTKL